MIAEISLREKNVSKTSAMCCRVKDLSILDRKARLADHLGCSSGRKNANILLNEPFSKVKQTSLVIDRDNRNALSRGLVLSGHLVGVKKCLLRGR